MSPKQRPRLPAFAAQLLLGIPGLALITFVCFWIGFGLGRTAFAYVILIALISLLGSFSASFVVSILAAACLNYFFSEPLFAFHIDNPDDLVKNRGVLDDVASRDRADERAKAHGGKASCDHGEVGRGAAHRASRLVGT